MIKTGISLVVISYNEENRIGQCLRSLLELDYAPLEILVVDASADNTGEIVKTINDARIRYLPVSTKGYSIQRNIGIRNARYPLIAFTDADCTVPSDWLSKLVPIVSGNVAGAGGNAFPPRGSKGLSLYIACLGFPAGGAIGLDANLPKTGKVILATCNAIFQRDILLRVGGFDETLQYGGEDTNICYSIHDAGYEIKYLRESYVCHQVRTNLIEFSRWCIRRGKADTQLKGSRLVSICSSGSILFVCIFCVLLVAIGISYSRYVTFLSSFMLFSLSSLILFTSTRKYRLAWTRRKIIGIGLFQLLAFVPALFFLRRLLMAIGCIRLITTELTE